MQRSRDIKLKSYGIDGLLIGQMSYTKKMYLYVRESPTRNIVCSLNIHRREAAKKTASYMTKNYTRDGTHKKIKKKCLEQITHIINPQVTSSLPTVTQLLEKKHFNYKMYLLFKGFNQ